ncbi:MAG TPA: NAD(P)/FAD-dependent oxidoreductase [Gemmatimonadota bacterium]|nr:NAD(P)/FAD-dependent oxidoreductase [Gemmatimonadota bacterium]
MTVHLDRPLDALVIGAGPAGLAASRELTRRGVAHAVLERGERVGTTWRNTYDSLTLHTGRHMSALPGLGHGRAAPLFLPRDAFVAYLERYADRFRLPLVTGREVTRARRADGGWVVDTPEGQARARHLVLATGIMSNPLRPEVAGEERFGGRVLHSVDYRRPGPFAGRRVLVVGAGNSAGEIASELAGAGVDVTLSVRSGANVVPLRLFGIPIQYLAFVVGQLPPPARSAVVGLVQRLTELRRGPPVLPRPAGGPLDSIPLIGFHLVDAIREGRVALRGGLTHLDEGRAHFAEGDAVAVDDVILATGFRAAVQPIRESVRVDERGFVRRTARVVAEGAQDLFVVGHNYDSTGGLFNIRRDAPRAARLIAGRAG